MTLHDVKLLSITCSPSRSLGNVRVHCYTPFNRWLTMKCWTIDKLLNITWIVQQTLIDITASFLLQPSLGNKFKRSRIKHQSDLKQPQLLNNGYTFSL